MGNNPPKVALFITCLGDQFFPQVGECVVRILRRVGAQVSFNPAQTCCGQPAFNAGLRAQALPVARHTIQVFEETQGPVVIPSGSCAAMVRHGYVELFRDDPVWLARAQALATRTYEFTEFLVDYLGITGLGAHFRGKLTYHSSCHLLRDLGISHQPRALLANIQDAELVELPHSDECCGFGGVFSAEHPEISSAMLERKMANIESSGSPLVVSCDAGCITHINGGLHHRGKSQQVVHIAEVLRGE